MARWLVTGAAGFIGSNIVARLLERGDEVVGLDNLSNGRIENISDSGLKDLRFIEGDIRDFDLCQKLCSEVDHVLHQAALGSVPRSIDDPLNSNDSNVTGFLNMLTASKNAGIRFVYASSGSVYGSNDKIPKKETMRGDALSPYAATKQINEIYAKVFKEVYNFNSVGLRYFNVYGPRQKFTGPYVNVIPVWARAFIQGDEVFINGDGEITRDFCHVDDVVNANILAATKKINDSVVVNIGSGENISLNNLFKLFKEKFGSDIEPTYKDYRLGDALRTLADWSKAHRLLDFTPTHTINTGLDSAIEWYTKELK